MKKYIVQYTIEFNATTIVKADNPVQAMNLVEAKAHRDPDLIDLSDRPYINAYEAYTEDSDVTS